MPLVLPNPKTIHDTGETARKYATSSNTDQDEVCVKHIISFFHFECEIQAKLPFWNYSVLKLHSIPIEKSLRKP